MKKNQIGQIVNMLTEQPQGTFPSNTEPNPIEQILSITTKSELQLLKILYNSRSPNLWKYQLKKNNMRRNMS